MNDPDDKTLLEFVCHFVGKTELEWIDDELWCKSDIPDATVTVPDYLQDLNAWHRDVWPKVSENKSLSDAWAWEFSEAHIKKLIMTMVAELSNADARSRCLALYRALDGKAPQ